MMGMTAARESVQKRQEFDKHSEWIRDTEELLSLLTRTLGSIVETWKEFYREDWPHIPGACRTRIAIIQINDTFRKLHDILATFEKLDAQLRDFKEVGF